MNHIKKLAIAAAMALALTLAAAKPAPVNADYRTWNLYTSGGATIRAYYAPRYYDGGGAYWGFYQVNNARHQGQYYWAASYSAFWPNR
jgi:hypothetical protein